MNTFKKIIYSIAGFITPFLFGQLLHTTLQTFHGVDMALFIFSGCGIISGSIIFAIWKD